MQNQKTAGKGYVVIPQGTQVLDQVASFLRKYLVCDDHQLTILALWVASTRFNQTFSTAAYLDIRSPEPCSGKTTCLNLLDCLCYTRTFLTGVSGATLIERCAPRRCFEHPAMEKDPSLYTLLLDDCHHTFTGSELQPVLSLLNSGSDNWSFFPLGHKDYNFFGPKAFASTLPLPRSLAARCIPIVLRRPRPSEKFSRLDSGIQEGADAIGNRLDNWAKNIRDTLVKAAQNEPAQLPPALSLAQRRCVEPLLHIADAAGSSWPEKARAAAVAAFNFAEASPQLQILWDVRAIFRMKDSPEYIPTADLLSELRKMDGRPWSEWSAKSGRRLADHLRPFAIGPEYVNRTGGGLRAYRIEHFHDAWERYLPPLSALAPLDKAAPVVGTEEEFRMKVNAETSSETRIPAVGAD
jgi:hypothetical protein